MYYPQESIGKYTSKKSVQRKVSQLYGRHSLLEGKERFATELRLPRLCVVLYRGDIKGTNSVYHFSPSSPCIAYPYGHLNIETGRSITYSTERYNELIMCFLQNIEINVEL